MFRPSPVPRSPRRLRRLPALVALFGAGLAFAAPAQAATISFSATDAKGDSKATAGHDIVKLEGTYDNTAGSFKVTATTAAPFSAVQGLLSVLVGSTVNGVCDYSDPGLEGVPPFVQFYLINIAETQAPPVFSYALSDISDEPKMTKSGNAITLQTKAYPELANKPFDCMYAVTAYESSNGGAVADTAFGLVVPTTGGDTGGGGGDTGGGGTGSGSGGGTAPIKIVTTEPDGDKDGIADSADKCPKEPGALANGCPVMKPADEFRLGAKRIVVDKLVPMTASACPPRVRITVTSKGKKLGTGVFKVDQHGSFCRIQGVVRLKSKKKAVRVVTKGTGMKSIAKSVKR